MCLARVEVKYPVLTLGVAQRQMKVSKGDKTWISEDIHLLGHVCIWAVKKVQKNSSVEYGVLFSKFMPF